MNTVTVRASKQYDILIGSGLLPTLGAEAKKLGKARTVCLVSESTVYPLYGKAAEDSLKSAGFFRQSGSGRRSAASVRGGETVWPSFC